MSRAVLLVAFHYPPYHGSSSVHRASSFSRYLPEHGWKPVVLTVKPQAYLPGTPDRGACPPDGVAVERVPALDASRHLSFRGRYPRLCATPDRWSSWWLSAIPGGLRLIEEHRPQAIWTTFPIATALLIGLTLQRLSGLPWIADFRDSMTEEHYPSNPTTWRVHRWIERRTVHRCRHAVFTTPGTRRMYAERYPDVPQDRWSIITNGFDEVSMAAAEREYESTRPPEGPLRLVHSGALYRSERDPSCFFEALGELRKAGTISPETLQVVLRGSGDKDYYRRLLRERGADGIVSLAEPLPHREALRELLDADGLLVLQASNCNHQIPAKIYEYLRARKPILALTDPGGDTATTLRRAGTGTVVPLDSAREIARVLPGFLAAIADRTVRPATDAAIAGLSRRHRTAELAALLDGCIQPSRSRGRRALV